MSEQNAKGNVGEHGVGRVMEMTRVFDAPREVVFAAWTDPKQVAQWWGPTGFTTPVCELDVQPGGAILIHMRAPGMERSYPMSGVLQRDCSAGEGWCSLPLSALDKDGKGDVR